MKSFHLAVFSSIVSWITIVNAKVIGPFALYTKSDDPNYDMRYVDASVRFGYNAIVDHITDPSQIPQQDINYYINSTSLSDPNSDTGNWVWGEQVLGGYMRYSAFWGSIQIYDPTSPIQPIYWEYNRETNGYATEWSLSSEGQLLLNGRSQFYAQEFHAPMWNYDALFWDFGAGSAIINGNASTVTLWKYP